MSLWPYFSNAVRVGFFCCHMWCLRSSKPCRQTELMRSLVLFSDYFWWDMISDISSRGWQCCLCHLPWVTGGIRGMNRVSERYGLAHWWVLMINWFSGMWISVKEKFKTPSLFIRAAAHAYLGAAEERRHYPWAIWLHWFCQGRIMTIF